MKAVIFAFTDKGSKLSANIAQLLSADSYTVEQYAMPKYCYTPEQLPLLPNLHTLTQYSFPTAKLLVYIGAVGIAVRAIAPFVRSKKTDPAIICIDELGKFTIPLLSGHIGGANRLAERLSVAIGSTSVITTATDINDLPAIDEWATNHQLHITDMLMAKHIAAMLLDGEPIGISSSYILPFEFPQGLVQRTNLPTGVFITDSTDCQAPYANTLFLLPKNIYLGIGCRRGVSQDTIEQFVLDKLCELNIDIGRVCSVASIDLKAQEDGLLGFADKYKLPTTFYSAAQLQQAAGDFSVSGFVQSITGVDNVCERAAILSSAGKLLLHKSSKDGVTLAVAVSKKFTVSTGDHSG